MQPCRLHPLSSRFVIKILPQNDAPSFKVGSNLTGATVVECRATLSADCSYSFPAWTTGISPGGGADPETSQTLQFVIAPSYSSSDAAALQSFAALFASPMSIDPSSGTLTFTLKRGGGSTNGIITLNIQLVDSGGTDNGGVNTYSTAVLFQIAVYIAPPSYSFDSSTATSVYEDAVAFSKTGWIINVNPGYQLSSGTSPTSILSFVVTTTNNALFATLPVVVFDSSTTATLALQPAADAYGSCELVVTLTNSQSSLTYFSSRTLTVVPVNDAPSFALVKSSVEVLQDSGATTVQLLSSISTGPANEATQTYSFNVTCQELLTSATQSTASLFLAAPSIDATGLLSFYPRPGVSGSAHCGIVMRDSGGTATPGSIDTSVATRYFDIIVRSINHAPSFIKGSDVYVLEDCGFVNISRWATQISSGDTNEVQALTFTVACTPSAATALYYSPFFELQPAVDPIRGDLTFAAVENANGLVSCTVKLGDDGSNVAPNVAVSVELSFTIRVLAVNDAPSFVAAPDATTIVLFENSGAYSYASWATKQSVGPVDEQAVQTYAFTFNVSDPSLFSIPPYVTAAGVLAFTLAANKYGAVSARACMTDSGGCADVLPAVNLDRQSKSNYRGRQQVH